MPNRLPQLIVLLLLFLAGDYANAMERHYYVAAEDAIWDYAPTEKNLVHCHAGSGPCPLPAPWTNSHKFHKVRYVEYADASFKTPKTQPQWLGVLGPIIRAEVGDTLRVHFCNHAQQGSYSLHPHGLRYDKDSEGAHYMGANSGMPPGRGAHVPPGACFDYTWHAHQESGPAAGEVSSKVWWYHSHMDEPNEVNRGLLGPIIVTRRGMAKADGSPRNVDKEFVAAFFIFNELDGEEPGLMHSINGLIFGNLKGFVAKKGDRVRWHLLGMGNELDLHTAHWHGHTVAIGSQSNALFGLPATAVRRTDVVELLPASMVTADMNASNVGEWLFHCHVADHIAAGMVTTYQVLPQRSADESSPPER